MNSSSLVSVRYFGLTGELVLSIKELTPGCFTLHIDDNLCYADLKGEVSPRKVVARLRAKAKCWGLPFPDQVYRFDTNIQLALVWDSAALTSEPRASTIRPCLK